MKKIEENWYALYLSIIKNMSCEKALLLMGKNGKRKTRAYSRFTVKQIKNMIALHEKGFSYKIIGEEYGVSNQVVYLKIKSFKQQEKEYAVMQKNDVKVLQKN